MKKISILMMICLILILNSFVFAEDDNSIQNAYNEGYDDGYNDGKSSMKSKSPLVKVIQEDNIPEVNAGEIIEFKIRFRNESRDNALNLHITPVFEDNKALVYERPLGYSTTVTLKGEKEGNTTFKIKTSSDAKKGTYPLKLKLEYKNSLGELFTREEAVYFKIASEKSKPILNVSNIKMSSNDLKYGDKFALSFDLTNIGESEANEVEVKLGGFSDAGIMPVDSKDYTFIGNLLEKKSINLVYDFAISEDIASRDSTITCTINYKGNDDKEYSATKNIYITGIKLKEKESKEKEKEKEEDKKYAKPKMIISSYAVSPNNIIAGDDFTFSFRFKNTSRERDIRNIKVTVSSTAGSFIITKGSNTFYIERMGRSETVNKQIELKAKQDLTSNSYEVKIDFDYEDYDGVEYSSQEVINIPVTEYSKLVINSANLSEGYVGNPTSLSFDYVNMGKAIISNLTATVSGDFTPSQESTYIGNVQAGYSDYYDIEVTPLKEGTNYGTLILTFEDSSGRKIEVTRDIEGVAYAEPTADPTDIGEDPGAYPEPQEEGKNFETWQIILAGIGAFLVTMVISRIITKKIILKKFEEDI